MAESAAEPVSVHLGPTRVEREVRSFKSIRDHAVVKQRFDFSCGAAAFATLLTYGLNDPVSEEYVLRQVLTRLTREDEALLKSKGLSLLDLQELARARGYKARGFRLAAVDLPKISRPVMVHIRPLGYAHFAVLKGVRGDRAYLADPSQGNWTLALYRFLDMWMDEQQRGVVFVVERQDGRWDDAYALRLPDGTELRPDLLSVREMLDFGLDLRPPFRPEVLLP